MGLSEGACCIVAYFIVAHVSRKKMTILGLGSSGVLCIVLVVLTYYTSSTNIFAVVILFVMRFVLCLYWAVMYVYIAELFPTRIRSITYGWLSGIGNLFGISCPFIVLAADELHINQWIFPGVICIMASLTGFLLPETLNKETQENI